ncbi:hypothetical protein RUM44_011727 [Polyplax serrata]|uniref:Uncharacterized protein n=1 Tax=Polyplax serrata TaxID=468196 RepID=A0ABR1AQU9_POLSC
MKATVWHSNDRKKRHRCPHKPESYEPPIYVDRNVSLNITSSQHEDYKAFGLDDIREFRSQPHKVVTELGLSEGTVESVTSYNSEYNHKNLVRQAAYQYEDHLHLEGDFHGRDREYRVVLRGEREPLKKPRDNLFLEGDFHGRPKDDYVPKIPDNVYQDGKFEGKRKDDFQPKEGEIVAAKRPKDNLHIDGTLRTEKRDDYLLLKGKIYENVPHEDNLKFEGEFTTKSTSQEDYNIYRDEIANIKKYEGNKNHTDLDEYEDITKKNREYSSPDLEQPHPASSSTYVRDAKTLSVSQQRTIHETSRKITENDDINIIGQIHFETSSHMDIPDKTSDNQKPLRRQTWTKIDAEKYFETRTMEDTHHSTVKNNSQHPELYSTHLTPACENDKMYSSHERSQPIAPEENLIPKLQFENIQKDESVLAERPKQKKPKDNLKPEGEFERTPIHKYITGERPKPVRPQDNLFPEGEFERRPKDEFVPAERPKQKKPKDNLKPEGEFEKKKNKICSEKGRSKNLKTTLNRRV